MGKNYQQLASASPISPAPAGQGYDRTNAIGEAYHYDPNAGWSEPQKPSGIDALAAAGQPQKQAQAIPEELSDAKLLDMLNQYHSQPSTAPSTTPPPASPASAASSVATQPAQAAGTPVMDINSLLGTYNHYRTFPAGAPLATQALGMIQKMMPEGYQLRTDPSGTVSLTPTPGGPADLKTKEDLAHAEAIGKATGTPTTARQGESLGMPTKPGQAPALEFHEQYQSPRLPEGAQTVPPPPGSPPGTPPSIMTLPGGTPAIGAAAAAEAGGKATVTPILDAEKVASETFGKHRDAFTSNQASAQNLNNFLEAANAVGTGKGTNLSANAAAWLKSINVDPQKLSLADPAEVERMRKASTQAIFSAIRGVSNRPAYQEFKMLEQAMPNPDLQPEANRAIASSLLGAMNWENAMFKSWDQSRRQTGSHLAFDLPAWAEANPMPGFQHAAYLGVPAIPSRGIASGPTEQPPMQGAIKGADGLWHITINGQSHTLRPQVAPGPGQ